MSGYINLKYQEYDLGEGKVLVLQESFHGEETYIYLSEGEKLTTLAGPFNSDFAKALFDVFQFDEEWLRGRYDLDEGSLRQMRFEASERGYNTPGDDYFGSELAIEQEAINLVLKLRGLAPCGLDEALSDDYDLDSVNSD